MSKSTVDTSSLILPWLASISLFRSCVALETFLVTLGLGTCLNMRIRSLINLTPERNKALTHCRADLLLTDLLSKVSPFTVISVKAKTLTILS